MSELGDSEPEELYSRGQQEGNGTSSEDDNEDSSSEEDTSEDNKHSRYKAISFEDRLKKLQDGAASFRPSQRNQNELQAAKAAKTIPTPKTVFKRKNKNRPKEQSSKFQVKRLREVIETGGRQGKDPRFDDIAGKLRDDVFKKRYRFLYEEQLPDEKKQLQKQMKKAKSSERRKELKSSLSRIQQQITQEQKRLKSEEASRQQKAKEKEAVKAGKKPYFMKNSEKKRQELLRKYEELKATGGLDKFIAKKRKRNATKDHRHIPRSR